jgi:uncharacterized membrane protein YozB (DUF420 family)
MSTLSLGGKSSRDFYHDFMLDAGTIILILKIAVIVVTGLLAASLTALWRGNYRLHGRINIAFFSLTLVALLGLELIANVVSPGLFEEHFERVNAQAALRTHLSFSIPSAALLLVMLPTGLLHYRRAHIGLGLTFLFFWVGTFITGVFFLPHE